MATIDGPSIQLPQTLAAFVDENGRLSTEATMFLRTVQAITFYETRSGPTASRPTSTSFRWVGMPFFDTTLGLPIFLKTASSSAWVKADGSAA